MDMTQFVEVVRQSIARRRRYDPDDPFYISEEEATSANRGLDEWLAAAQEAPTLGELMATRAAPDAA